MNTANLQSALPALVLGVAFLLPVSGAAAIPEWRMSLALDPAGGSLQGELHLELPEGPHEFRLLEGFQLSQVEAGERELDVTQPFPGRYGIVLPPDPGTVVVRWSGSLPGGDPMRSPLFLTPAGGFLPEGTDWYPASNRRASPCAWKHGAGGAAVRRHRIPARRAGKRGRSLQRRVRASAHRRHRRRHRSVGGAHSRQQRRAHPHPVPERPGRGSRGELPRSRGRLPAHVRRAGRTLPLRQLHRRGLTDARRLCLSRLHPAGRTGDSAAVHSAHIPRARTDAQLVGHRRAHRLRARELGRGPDHLHGRLPPGRACAGRAATPATAGSSISPGCRPNSTARW
jgi:hypothetical protein